uniref:Uncharacterized protein n=1 Tax=Romanomermis culicivorax TaxID=13658 RepID=A0A915JZ67_ROMCU
MVTTTREPGAATRSIAPPMPFTIFPWKCSEISTLTTTKDSSMSNCTRIMQETAEQERFGPQERAPEMSTQELAMQLGKLKGTVEALLDIIANAATEDNKREANSR